MKPINNWNNVTAAQPGGSAEKLPAGGYICKIKSAKVETVAKTDGGSFDMLAIAFDIDDGAYMGFFEDQFRNNTFENKKWKGVFRQSVPVGDGSDKDNRTASFFKGMITSIEKSNPGYAWNWDERTLSGKRVGIVFREEEYSFNGYQGMTTKPFLMLDAQDILEGKYTIPKPKMLQKAAAAPGGFGAAPAGFGAAPAYVPEAYTSPVYNGQPMPQFEEIDGDDTLPF